MKSTCKKRLPIVNSGGAQTAEENICKGPFCPVKLSPAEAEAI